ncbi:MAG: hypothetical protein ACXWWR_05535 [Candidatus Limnocylindrales bacterium]
MTDHDETEPTAAPPKPDLDDDDVEGHGGMASRADGGPDDFGQMRARARIDGDEEDVEGHFGHLKSPSSRGE